MDKILKLLCTYCILISVCYATPPSCLDLHQSQLNTLNERMNQMLSALYSSPILSKLKSVTNSESNPESTTAGDETPEAVYDTSTYYAPPVAGVSPQVVYLSNTPPPSNTPTSEIASTRTARSYYQPDVPLEYLTSPWSQYYDPYRSAISAGYPPTLLQNQVTSVYGSYFTPASYPPYIPPSYPHPPTYPTVPPLPPNYSTPPPIYQTPPPVYQTPSAYKPLPPTYQTPPPYKSLPSTYSSPPPYQALPSSYQSPPPTYAAPSISYPIPPPSLQIPSSIYNTPSPIYSTPPPIYSPSAPINPYTPVRYSRGVEFSPYYNQSPL